jgi:hypothetical protein
VASSNIATTLSPAERAHHPEEVLRSNGTLVPDVQWYLTQQLVPPIARLCEPIEGTSAATIAQHMGLDPTKFNKGVGGSSGAGNTHLQLCILYTTLCVYCLSVLFLAL